MGPVETIVSTAWADIQSRFASLAAAAGLPVPTFSYGEKNWSSRNSYPAMFLALDYVRQDTSSMLAEELEVAMDLVLVQTSAEPETLQDQMMQYTDCMLELVRDDHTFGGACQIGAFVSSELYDGSEQDRDLAIAIISINLRTEVLI